MSSNVKEKILKLKESSTLVINEKSKELISNGKKVYQFGFGQSPFPVPEKIVEALKKISTDVLCWKVKQSKLRSLAIKLSICTLFGL